MEAYYDIDHMNCAAHHITRPRRELSQRFRKYPNEKPPEAKIPEATVPHKPIDVKILIPRSRLPAHLHHLAEPVVQPEPQDYLTSDTGSSVISETPRMYANLTLRYLNKMNAFNLQWVNHILNHSRESHRIIFEDPDPETGFILLPDSRNSNWDEKSIESLHLTAIVHLKGIKSLRDLHSAFLPLLTNILENGTKIICMKYGIHPCQLFVYINYQPEYYHFHVHFSSTTYRGPECYTLERSHLLQDVIANIERNAYFYLNGTLTFTMRKDHILSGHVKNYIDYDPTKF